jgi:dihydroorotate dehydrogenase electron transfer subunit
MEKIYIPQKAEIVHVRDLNESTRMFTFNISLGAAPGQFVNVWIPHFDEKPFSVADDDGEYLQLAVARVGPFTEQLFQRKKGESIGIRGPYGNSFSVSKGKHVVLVGGGFGVAPLHFLGRSSQAYGSQITMIIGSRTKELLLYEDEVRQSNFRVLVTTNDGSAGEKGLATLPLSRILEEREGDIVQTCGPEKMMEAVAKMCSAKGISCEVSLERYMKCGFGLCGQCACGNKLVCRDGCVFSAEEVLDMEDFGKFHRDEEGKKKYY